MSLSILRNLASFSLRLVPHPMRRFVHAVPLIGAAQRSILSRVYDRSTFVHTVDAGPAKGCRFEISMPEDKGIWTGTYESEFSAAIAGATRQGDIAYDIGGWHGFFAAVMAAQGAREVHVFEPLPENARRIARMVELNPQFQIRLHQMALGSADTETDLMVMPQTSMAKLAESPFQPSASEIERIPVKLARLDRLVSCGALQPPDLIKMDVEGAEAGVLKGATEVLRSYRPRIFFEAHSTALLQECSEILEGVGYRISMMDRDLSAARVRDVFHVDATPA